ncbi:hypothetical protein [Tuwongella immobilis]|uniref:Uncharacterized protein n=1 Tax=Tuwongella immobilis TaxID=692036 RepID=A0A6C2YSX6_9BACT|nr:hypothetical protein [Tuwongella immobilis]VIP04481.1 unnamed protein product [Tuwongella immobilis]VTS06324.1 unnamed protein product [Tuwongella immobilis]
MIEQFLQYLLGTLDPTARRQVETHLAEHPEAQVEFDRLQAALSPVDADAVEDHPPADLATRTVAFIASHCITERYGDRLPEWPTPSDASSGAGSRDAAAVVPGGLAAALTTSPPRLAEAAVQPNRSMPSRLARLVSWAGNDPEMSQSWWSRRNVVAGAMMILFGFGIIIPGIYYAQMQRQLHACQEQLREQYAALTGYADVHDGYFPKIQNVPPHDTARSYLTQLIQSGYWDETAPWGNSREARHSHDPSMFAYTLGYRDESGTLTGYSRTHEDASEHLPLMADRPRDAQQVAIGTKSEWVSHHGQNVLYLGGHVRACRDSRVGIAGDEIYSSERGRVEAGRHRWDTVLGWDQASP